MNYLNGQTVKVGDQAIGRDKAGNVCCGAILATNPDKETVQLSPGITHPVWVPANQCLPASELPKAKPAPKASATATTPEETPTPTPTTNEG